MGLINLVANQADFYYYQSKGYVGGLGNFSAKKLPYGNDLVGNGNSNQPYIKTPIPDTFSTYPNQTKDTFLRGGNDYLSIVSTNLQRISAFINDERNPSFGIFLDKQKELYKQQSKLPSTIAPSSKYDVNNLYINLAGGSQGLHERGKGESNLPSINLNAPLGPQLSALALAGRVGNLFDNETTYETQTRKIYNNIQFGGNFFQNTNSNRLGLLWALKINNVAPTGAGIAVANSFNIALLNNQNLFYYPEGPNGPLNFYRRAIDTTSWSDNPGGIVQIGSPPQVGGINAWFSVFTSNNLFKYSNDNTFKSAAAPGSSLKDFRQFISTDQAPDPGSVAANTLSFTDYSKFNRVTTYKMGDPGVGNLNRSNPYSVAPLGADGQPAIDTVVDQVNYKPIYSSDKPNEDVANADSVPFYIAVINLDDPTKNNYLHFRAYISGLSDQYGAEWGNFKYTGRGENFYTYGGFTRTISMNFIAHANSRAEHKVMYQKLNYLASLLAPNYSSFNKSVSGFMRGNIVKLTIGDYLVDQPGIITALTFNVDDMYSWDIGKKNDGTKDPDALNLPQTINVSGFSFTPIHSFLPKTLNQDWIDKTPNSVFDSPYVNMGINQTTGLSSAFIIPAAANS
jgi:hypothetical protein